MSDLNTNAALVRILDSVIDPRMNRCKIYPLSEVLFLCLVSTICNARSFGEMVEFGELNLDWFRKYFPYESGVPSHDTINRCMSLVCKVEMEKMLQELIRAIRPNVEGKQISIDGKSLSSSVTKLQQQTSKENGGKNAVHLLGAYCNDWGLTIGRMDIESKGSEGNNIPAFLDKLWVKGAIISLDAGGCYTEVVDAIVEREADYLITVKENQPTLNQAISAAFAEGNVPKENCAETLNVGHGREEIRSCKVLSASCLSEELTERWKGLKTIVEIEYIAVKKGADLDNINPIRIGIRNFISSKVLTPAEAMSIARKHWGIENEKHFVLDTILFEDDARMRGGNTPANMALMRSVALNYLKSYQIKCAKKKSLVQIRTGACTSSTRRDEVLASLL